MWLQRELTLEPRPRGFHLVTHEVLAQLPTTVTEIPDRIQYISYPDDSVCSPAHSRRGVCVGGANGALGTQRVLRAHQRHAG